MVSLIFWQREERRAGSLPGLMESFVGLRGLLLMNETLTHHYSAGQHNPNWMQLWDFNTQGCGGKCWSQSSGPQTRLRILIPGDFWNDQMCGLLPRHSDGVGLEWGPGFPTFYSGAGNQIRALWGQRSGSTNLASRCGCGLRLEQPSHSVVAAASATAMSPCCSILPASTWPEMGHIHHHHFSRPPSVSRGCSAAPGWYTGGRESRCPSLHQSKDPPHEHFQDDCLLGYVPSPEKTPTPPTRLQSTSMAPTRYAQESPQLCVTWIPHSEMRIICGLLCIH